MAKEFIYDVDLQWKEGRIGTLSSPVLNDTVTVATPPEFDKGVEGVWSPEHLFISSVSSCLMTTFLSMADFSRLEFDSFTCSARGVLGKMEGKFGVTQITLSPRLLVKHEKDLDKGRRLLEKAEGACLITNSIKTEVIFKPEVNAAG